MAFFKDAIEILRRIVVAVGTKLFFDSMEKHMSKFTQTIVKQKDRRLKITRFGHLILLALVLW